jgi:hypothetical protein
VKIEKTVKAIAGFGGRYHTEHLSEYVLKQATYLEDPYAALSLFFGYAFLRGRRDTISVQFYRRAMTALDSFRKQAGDTLFSSWDAQASQELAEVLLRTGVNNQYDRRMVGETLNFIHDHLEPYGYNIVASTLARIRSQDICRLHADLDTIFAIGDKLACIFLRDVVDIYGLESCLEKHEERHCVQPVDTWVGQVLSAAGVVAENATHFQIKQRIIEVSEETGTSGIRVNQGTWYAGYNSLRLLLEILAE